MDWAAQMFPAATGRQRIFLRHALTPGPSNSHARPSGSFTTESYFGSNHQRCIKLLMPWPVPLSMSKKLGMPGTGVGSNFMASRFMR